MRAVILAAGVGRRLGPGRPPKCLLPLGGKTLLRRHLECLAACRVEAVTVVAGHRAGEVAAELAAFAPPPAAEVVVNPRYREGSLLSLHAAADALTGGGPVLLMDADVLYDPALLARLVGSGHENCLLMDRAFEPGDEPVKLCLREGRIVELRKGAPVPCDHCGESVGFFRLAAPAARALAAICAAWVAAGRTDEPYEEALRELVLGAWNPSFGWEEVTGLPWIEIDFPEDLARAEAEVLPRIPAAAAPA